LLQAIAEIKLPEELPYSKSVYHLCVLRVQDRDALQRELTQAGIGTGVHYPTPMYLQKAYTLLGTPKVICRRQNGQPLRSFPCPCILS